MSPDLATVRDRLRAPLTRRRAVLIVAVAVIVLVAATAVYGWASRSRDAVTAREQAATQVAAQAGSLVADVFSVDRSQWQADRARAAALLAEPLATSQRAALAAGPPDGVAAIRWSPVEAGVVRAEADIATAVVVADVTVVAGDGAQESTRKTVQADLVRRDGRWLLSGLDELQ